ncbi:hypothetical protein ACS0TY_011540 [Phlomoides rotata]
MYEVMKLMMLRSIMNRTVVIVVIAIGILRLNQERYYDMDENATGVSLDGGKGKATRGRRTWSKIEEDVLIQALTDIVSDGWKADNGFRAGFQRELEKGIRKLLPGTDLVANPHINSKIHVWKKDYGSQSDLLSKSGIGWNSTTQTIDVIDETVWTAQKMLNIFGNDRATGENVVDLIDMVNSFFNNAPEEEGDNVTKCDDKFATPTVDVVGD